jgi:hypothetical protein
MVPTTYRYYGYVFIEKKQKVKSSLNKIKQLEIFGLNV